MSPAGHCTRPWQTQAGAKTCPANLPHSAKEWAHFPWQTSGRSRCLWAPTPPLSPWRTARCLEHPCSRWPGAKQHKDCSSARLHHDATTSNSRGSWPSPDPLSLQPRACLTPVLPGSRNKREADGPHLLRQGTPGLSLPLTAPVSEEVRIQTGTYIWLEGGVQHACFQPPEVEVLEERVLLHFLGPSSSAPQALQRVFAQELQHTGNQCPGWRVLQAGAALRSAGLLQYISRDGTGPLSSWGGKKLRHSGSSYTALSETREPGCHQHLYAKR